MNVCLIFSPFSWPSHIPLGISYLKSFIEKNIPSVQVKNLDLSNNLYHNLAKKEFFDPLVSVCRICPLNKNPRCNGIFRNKTLNDWEKIAFISEQYSNDPETYRTDSKTNAFSNARKYTVLRSSYDSFLSQISSCINRVLRRSLEASGQESGRILENTVFQDDIDRIVSENPEIIGFSVFSESQVYYSLALAKIIKARIHPRIIFGGACISHLDKKAMLRMFDCIDFIIYKEGEPGIVGLLNSLKTGIYAEVPNLVYRKRGRVIENKEAVVRNLDHIPFPDFSDFTLDRYFKQQYLVLPALFSRGCFWGACTFCAHHKTYAKPYRTRSIPNLARELEEYRKRGITYINFADESISAKDLDRIDRALLKKKIKIKYQVMLRPTEDFTCPILKRMYQAGCRSIIWGVESFNQRILDVMNKGTRVTEIEKILKNACTIGLTNIVFMIQGFPTQTEAEMARDRETLQKNSKYIHEVLMHDFWLEEDTAIFRNPKKFGLEHLRRQYLLKNRKSKLFSTSVSFTPLDPGLKTGV